MLRRTWLPSPTISERTIPPLLCGFARPFFIRCKIWFCFHRSAEHRPLKACKLVTRKYPYLVYYTVDEASQEIIILTVQHPAREREHDDA